MKQTKEVTNAKKREKRLLTNPKRLKKEEDKMKRLQEEYLDGQRG